MVRYLKLYNKFLKQYIKTLMEYRADFLLGLIGFILVQGVGIVFIGLVFNSIPTLKRWSFYEILFIYGLSIKYFCKISNNNIPSMDKGHFNFYYSFCFYRLFSSSLYIRKRKLFIRGSAYICSKFYINSYSI